MVMMGEGAVHIYGQISSTKSLIAAEVFSFTEMTRKINCTLQESLLKQSFILLLLWNNLDG